MEKKVRTILFIDDNQACLYPLIEYGKILGYVPIGACCSRDALALLEKSSNLIDLAILDIELPDENGLELYKKIKRLYPQLDCIFLSGHLSNQIPPNTIAFEKPIKLEKLFAAINARLQ